MKKIEIKKIIQSYKPHNEFFDLSVQPKSLNNEEYAKILKIQNCLTVENEKFKDKRIRECNRVAWEQLKVLSGQLQAIIFKHWDFSELNLEGE